MSQYLYTMKVQYTLIHVLCYSSEICCERYTTTPSKRWVIGTEVPWNTQDTAPVTRSSKQVEMAKTRARRIQPRNNYIRRWIWLWCFRWQLMVFSIHHLCKYMYIMPNMISIHIFDKHMVFSSSCLCRSGTVHSWGMYTHGTVCIFFFVFLYRMYT